MCSRAALKMQLIQAANIIGTGLIRNECTRLPMSLHIAGRIIHESDKSIVCVASWVHGAPRGVAEETLYSITQFNCCCFDTCLLPLGDFLWHG